MGNMGLPATSVPTWHECAPATASFTVAAGGAGYIDVDISSAVGSGNGVALVFASNNAGTTNDYVGARSAGSSVDTKWSVGAAAYAIAQISGGRYYFCTFAAGVIQGYRSASRTDYINVIGYWQ